MFHEANELYRERSGREEARDEWGEDADDGHDDRIEIARANEQIAANQVAHFNGEYEYDTRSMRDVDGDLHRELEEEHDRRWQVEENEEQRDDEDEDDGNGSDMDIVDDDSD